jgi:hypothetical protein
MPWPRLPLEYVRNFLRAMPWRLRSPVQRVHRLQANDYSLGSPDFAKPPVSELHPLQADNYSLGTPGFAKPPVSITSRPFPGDNPEVARARRRLVRFMKNNPDPRKLRTPEHRRKDVIRKIYRARFKPLSKRAFDELWDFAVSESGATAWREPGPK